MRAKLILTALAVMLLEGLAVRSSMGRSIFDSSPDSVLVLGFLGLAIIVGFSLVLMSQLLRRITEIEIALLESSRGGDVTPIALRGDALDGLAYRVNAILEARKSPPEGEPRVEAEAPVAAAPPPTVDADTIARVAAESEEAYRARVYDEYVAAKRALGEDVSGIDRDRFTRGLAANAERTARKLGCGRVRFRVRSEGGTVSLDPITLEREAPVSSS